MPGENQPRTVCRYACTRLLQEHARRLDKSVATMPIPPLKSLSVRGWQQHGLKNSLLQYASNRNLADNDFHVNAGASRQHSSRSAHRLQHQIDMGASRWQVLLPKWTLAWHRCSMRQGHLTWQAVQILNRNVTAQRSLRFSLISLKHYDAIHHDVSASACKC